MLGGKRPIEDSVYERKKPVKEGRKLVSVLKPPSDGVGPGRTAGLLVSRKQSSYDREGEGVLLAAVFEGGEEVRQEGHESVVQAGQIDQSALWRSASYSCSGGRAAIPLSERIAQSKSRKQTAATQSKATVAVKAEKKRSIVAATQLSSRSIQLQALRTELVAAEATVVELKRLITELEGNVCDLNV